MEPAEACRPAPSRDLPFWIGLGSSALLVGAFVPLEQQVLWRAGVIFHWYDDPSRTTAHLLRWTPACLGALGWTFLAAFPRTLAARFLVVVAAASLAIYTLVSLVVPWRAELRLLSQLVISSALIAAGNRVARRHPEQRLPAVLAWIGAVQVVITFATWVNHPYRDILLFEITFWLRSLDWASCAFALALLAYGILAASILPRLRPVRLRRAALSHAALLLLILCPLALLQHWEFRGRDGAPLIKGWLLGTGHTLLLASGLAGWLEARYANRGLRSSP